MRFALHRQAEFLLGVRMGSGIGLKHRQPLPGQRLPRWRSRVAMLATGLVQRRHQRRPLHQSIKIVRASESQLISIQITRPDSQLTLGKSAGNVVHNIHGDSGLLAHLRFSDVHFIQAGEKLRPPGRIQLQARHPAGRQRHGPRIVRRTRLGKQLANFRHQRQPDLVALLILLRKRQRL